MDEIIYLLVLVAWLALSFYQSSQKKKTATRTSPKPETRPEKGKKDESTVIPELPEKDYDASESGEDFKKILEELIGKEPEPEIPEMIYTEESLETVAESYDEQAIKELETSRKITDTYLQEALSVSTTNFTGKNELGDQISDTIAHSGVISEQDSEEIHHVGAKWFDLRAAVIYSEILYRKY